MKKIIACLMISLTITASKAMEQSTDIALVEVPQTVMIKQIKFKFSGPNDNFGVIFSNNESLENLDKPYADYISQRYPEASIFYNICRDLKKKTAIQDQIYFYTSHTLLITLENPEPLDKISKVLEGLPSYASVNYSSEDVSQKMKQEEIARLLTAKVHKSCCACIII